MPRFGAPTGCRADSTSTSRCILFFVSYPTRAASIFFGGIRIIQMFACRQLGVTFEMLGPQWFGNRVFFTKPFAEVHEPASTRTERPVRTGKPIALTLARGAGNRLHNFAAGRMSPAIDCKSLPILLASAAEIPADCRAVWVSSEISCVRVGVRPPL